MLTIELLNKQGYSQELDALERIIVGAFAGFPWFETLSRAEAKSRVETQQIREGTQIIVARNENDKVVATSWLDSPTLEQLEIERGQQIRQFVEKIMKEQGVVRLLWERELLVDPEYQKQGIGTELRAFVMAEIDKLSEKTLILSRMRDDNVGTIKIAERLGFQRTGITKPSSQTPDFNHEYWYRVGGQ